MLKVDSPPEKQVADFVELARSAVDCVLALIILVRNTGDDNVRIGDSFECIVAGLQ